MNNENFHLMICELLGSEDTERMFFLFPEYEANVGDVIVHDGFAYLVDAVSCEFSDSFIQRLEIIQESEIYRRRC